ncbi:hypothetical protein KY319_00325, partial [Candidatus Woesearchaeota archaeon]|nr:hypothetical protein [Candidatus Woesearchaeota archaeon]
MTEINKKIQRYTFCAVIEVTNGVSKHRLQEKVEQALNGKQHVQENNPFTNVYSGLIFYRNANVANLNTAPLDFVLQIPQYERGTLIEAVIAAQSRQTDAQNKYIARALRSLIKRNVNINTLLYPNKRTWPTLTEDFGSLAGDRTLKEYHARIADVKGAML